MYAIIQNRDQWHCCGHIHELWHTTLILNFWPQNAKKARAGGDLATNWPLDPQTGQCDYTNY